MAPPPTTATQASLTLARNSVVQFTPRRVQLRVHSNRRTKMFDDRRKPTPREKAWLAQSATPEATTRISRWFLNEYAILNNGVELYGCNLLEPKCTVRSKVNRRSFVCYAAIGVATALLGESKPATSSARFTRIYLDERTGDVHIVNATGKDVSVPKRPPFEAVSDPKLAENGLAAGWLVEMKTDANYPVPVGVAIFREREG